MESNSLVFNQYRLIRLYTQPVQCWCTVQHNRVTVNYIFKDFPNYLIATINYFFRTFNRLDITSFNKPTNYKRLIQFNSHLFWKTTFMHLKVGANYNYGTTGVVNTLSKKVLTESTTFTFQHITERFQRTIVVTNRVRFS